MSVWPCRPIEQVPDQELLAGFDDDYETARAHFVALCRDAGIRCDDYPIGDGETLCVASLGDPGSARKLIVLSGVHGVEGYAGSAAQIAFLRRYRDTAPRVHVLLCHVVNPHGMRHFRRTARGNVDLNRNFVDDHQSLARIDPAGRTVGQMIAGRRAARLSDPVWLVWMAARLPRHGGLAKLKHVFAAGQYFDPTNLFYGGRERAAEIDTLIAALRAEVGHGMPDDILFFDLHSGIGPFGACTLLANGCDEATATKIFGAPVRQGHEGADAVYPVHGDLVRGVANALGVGGACAVTFECGTGSPLRTFLRLRYENAARHHYPTDAARAHTARQRMLRAFCPRSARWRLTYVRAANHFLDRAVHHLASAEPAHV
jgi:hypothetical protein